MNKILKIIFAAALLLFVQEVSISAQNEGDKTGKFETEKLSKLIPIKEGTTLRKIKVTKNTSALDSNKLLVPNQTQNYVRPSKKDRFKHYLNRTIGTGLIGVAVGSIMQQITEKPPEWEKNGKGFLRRFGSNLGTKVISESMSYGLEESLKLDSKFYKSKKKDFGSRVKNAVLSSFTARRPNGKRVFNPSRIAGRYTSEIIAAETWYPNRYSYKDGLRRATQGVGFDIGLNFLREFLFPK